MLCPASHLKAGGIQKKKTNHPTLSQEEGFGLYARLHGLQGLTLVTPHMHTDAHTYAHLNTCARRHALFWVAITFL